MANSISELDGQGMAYEGRVTPDNRLAPRVDIRCWWVEVGVTGEFELWVRDMTPRADGGRRLTYKVKVLRGRLVCGCPGYVFHKHKTKTCKHLGGNNALDGVGGWLEAEVTRTGLKPGQVSFLKSCWADPHRQDARRELIYRGFQQQRAAGGPADVESKPKPKYRLEDIFE